MGWTDDARRTVVSDKKKLVSMEGYWVKVRKWSISAKDEIDQANTEAQKKIDKKALFEVAKSMKNIDSLLLENMTTDEMLKTLTVEQFTVLSEQSSIASGKVVETKIRYGLDSHNFCDGDIDTRSTDKDIKGFASQIIGYPDVAYEILRYIEEFNRPPVQVTSKPSGMLQNGSTTEPSLTTETFTPTEEAQQN